MGQLFLTAVAGFGTSIALIVAIGAQNAFVLRQGIRGDAVLAVVLTCAASDAVLISLGVGGLGALVTAMPAVLTVVTVLGVGFLLCYGLLAARRALRPSALQAAGGGTGSTRKAVLTCLTVTWLNPHAYLDTVVLIGSVAAASGSLRWVFGLGALLGSMCLFVALGFGARLLSGFFARPSSWRVLDGLIAVVMIALGVMLVLRL